MAAAFLHRGASLLTDDLLPLSAQPDAIYGMPGPALMKLWGNSAARTLGLATDDLPNVTRNIDKKLIVMNGQYPLAEDPVPLRGIYVLERYVPSEGEAARIESTRVGQRESMTSLVGHISGTTCPTPAQMA